MNTIRQLCNRCIVLDKGKIVYDGDVEEAIEVYMGVSVDLSNYYEYSGEFHTNKGLKNIYLTSLEICDKEFSRIQINGKFNLVLECEVKKPCKHVKFRFEIQYADGTVAAAAFTDKEIDFLQVGAQKIDLEFDASHLAPGRYKADMVAYSIDPFGNDIYLDGVIPALSFEITDNEIVDENSNWLHRYWGHARLNDIHVL